MAMVVPELPLHSSLVSARAVLSLRETLQRNRGNHDRKGRSGLPVNGAGLEDSIDGIDRFKRIGMSTVGQGHS